MVRLYAINGDPRYREYFDEILAIRNGDTPRPDGYLDVPYWDIVLATGERPGAPGDIVRIRTLAREAGLGEDERALFESAEDASNKLAELENEVMDAVALQVEAGGEYVLEGEALAAMRRLHGHEYFAAKSMVMTPLVELAHRVDVSLEASKPGMQQLLDEGFLVLLVLLALSFVLSVAGIWQRRREQ